MSDFLKRVEYQGDSMSWRLGNVTEGQLSLPVYPPKHRCEMCSHFYKAKSGDAKGRCHMVKTHSKKHGKPFDGKSAWACSQYIEVS